MGILNRPGDLAEQRRRLPRRHRPLGQPPGETAALDVGHREEVPAVVLPHLEDRHNPGVVEIGRRLRLSIEPLDVGLIGKLASQDHLQRHGAVEAHLSGVEDDAHAAARDLADPLPDPGPHPALQPQRGRDVHRDRVEMPPVTGLDGREPRPAGAGQGPALAPPVAPAHHLEPPVPPDRLARAAIAIEETDLLFAPALVGATLQPVPLDQLHGQLAPRQGDPDAHRQKQVFPLTSQMSNSLAVSR
jgi:hypothetical protein